MSRTARTAATTTTTTTGFGGLAALKAALPPGPVAVAPVAAPVVAPVVATAPAILVPGGPLLPAGWRVEVRVEAREPFWPEWRAETVDVTVYDGPRVIGGPRAAIVAAVKAALAPASRDDAAWLSYIWGLRPRPAGSFPRHLQVPPILAREAAWRDAASREDSALLGEAEGLVRWDETQRLKRAAEEREYALGLLGAALSRALANLAEGIAAFADAYQAGVAAGLAGHEPAWETYRQEVVSAEQSRLKAAYGDERVVVGTYTPPTGRLRDYDSRGDWRAAGEPQLVYGLRAEAELRSFVERFDAESRRKTAFHLGFAEGAFERTR